MSPRVNAQVRSKKLLEAVARELDRRAHGEKSKIQIALDISANKLPRAFKRGNIDLVTFLGLLEILGLDHSALAAATFKGLD